jgi:hypothetical protein
MVFVWVWLFFRCDFGTEINSRFTLRGRDGQCAAFEPRVLVKRPTQPARVSSRKGAGMPCALSLGLVTEDPPDHHCKRRGGPQGNRFRLDFGLLAQSAWPATCRRRLAP